MIPLTAATASSTGNGERGSMWMSALFSGVTTAIFAFLFVTFFRMENPVLYIIALLLIGAGPVLGYALSRGRLGSSIGALVGGVIGGLLLALLMVAGIALPIISSIQGFMGVLTGIVVVILSVLLWSVLVGILDKTQSVGKLFLGNLVGALLGVGVFLLIANAMGQNPSWLGTGIIALMAVWGFVVGAAMSVWAKF